MSRAIIFMELAMQNNENFDKVTRLLFGDELVDETAGFINDLKSLSGDMAIEVLSCISNELAGLNLDAKQQDGNY